MPVSGALPSMKLRMRPRRTAAEEGDNVATSHWFRRRIVIALPLLLKRLEVGPCEGDPRRLGLY
jgi:hypothetical protein